MRLFSRSGFGVPFSFERRVGATVMAASLLASSGGVVTASAGSPPAADPVVITDWNKTAVDVIVGQAGKANAEAFWSYAYAQLAVYNAVEGITGQYDLYKWVDGSSGRLGNHGSNDASPQAAAAQAAHDILHYYFPTPVSQAYVDNALDTSLAAIPNSHSRMRGIRFGARAAQHIIDLRMNDGRNAPVFYTRAPAVGIWRPTGSGDFLAPWLSQMQPLTLTSTSQFDPGPPPDLTSDTYTADFNEVKKTGKASAPLTDRDASMTETAKFFSDIAVGALQGSLRDLVSRYHLDISDSARLFAAVDSSISDAIGVEWYNKFAYAQWRPITAIQLADTDPNPLTDKEDGWVPLITTPPYPDYTSGLNGVIGSSTRALARILGTDHIDLNISSVAAGTPGFPLMRHYELESDINADAINARVWGGIHFRTGDVVGNALGKLVGDYALDHYFGPASGH
jgi:hypothetical protein